MSPLDSNSDASPLAPERVRPWLALAAAIGAPLALGGLGGAVTASSLQDWYAGIRKPSWNPPSWIFGPVWTVLYVMMGVASWRAWRAGTGPSATPATRAGARSAVAVYAAQLWLNAAWTPVFFGLKRTDLAFGLIAVLVAAVAETTRRFARLDRPAALLMIPYLAWTAFAAVLNGRIWQLNR